MIAIMKNEIKDDVRSVFPKVGTEGEFLGTSMRMNHMMVDVRFKMPFVDQLGFLICPADWDEERAEIESAGLNGYMLLEGDGDGYHRLHMFSNEVELYAEEELSRKRDEERKSKEEARRLADEILKNILSPKGS